MRKSLKAFPNVEQVQHAFVDHEYICDRPLATAVYLAMHLEKPLFLEGEAGVGKTEVAKVLAAMLGARLIRLQCYEGLDVNTSLYEWNYPKQILTIKLAEKENLSRDEMENMIFTPDFLVKRPLLMAIQDGGAVAPVLLIDEIDRSDEEFEAFLLEVLSDFQISIPEIGTIRAKHRPLVVLTSNRTREIRDALKRRCLYHWIDYPSFEKEVQIVTTKVPGIATALAEQICDVMQKIRQGDFLKRPGIAETLDWAAALLALHKASLDPQTVQETLGCIFKYKEDIDRMSMDSCTALMAARPC